MSLKQIAKLAGVSVSTVSRILSDKSQKYASEKTRKYVFELAREINYTPNMYAKALQSNQININKKYSIMVVFGRIRETQSNSFFTELENSITLEILKLGHIILKTNYADNMINQSVPSVNGVIVLGKCDKNILNQIKKKFKNIICVGLNYSDFEYDQVICNGQKAAKIAVEYLIKLGHKKIGYVGECTTESRFLGYKQTLSDNKINIDKKFIFETIQSELGGSNILSSIINSEIKVTALFCANDITAIGLINEYKKYHKKYHLPDIISVDDIDRVQFVKPLLTTIHVPIKEMGKISVKLLIDRISGEHKEPIIVEFPCKLVKRESC